MHIRVYIIIQHCPAIIYFILSPPPFRSSPVGQSFREEEKNARWRQKIIISFRKYFHLHFIINPLLLAARDIAAARSFTAVYTPTNPACTFHSDSINSTTKRHNRIIPGALSSTLLRVHTRSPTQTHVQADTRAQIYNIIYVKMCVCVCVKRTRWRAGFAEKHTAIII